MKILIAALVTSLTFAGAASAGGGAPGDWTGFYLGGMATRMNDSEHVVDGTGTSVGTFDMKGSGAGLFAGYNHQQGNMVYGVELAYSPLTADDPDNNQSVLREKYLDLKGRFGFTSNQALFYGVLGYSKATAQENPANVDESSSGVAYGIGVDVKFGGMWFVGAELLERRFDTDYDASGFAGYTGDGKARSVSVRVGLSF